MLHKNVIENKGGFRTLSDAELEAVSGGNSFTPSLDSQEGNQIFVIRSASSFVQSLIFEAAANIEFLTDLANSNQNFIDPGLINAAIAGVANQASSADESDGGDAETQPEDNSEDFVDEDGDELDDRTGEPLTIVVTPNFMALCGGAQGGGGIGQFCADTNGTTSVRVGVGVSLSLTPGAPGPAFDLEDTRSIEEFGIDVNPTNMTVNVPSQVIVEAAEKTTEDLRNVAGDSFEIFSDGLFEQFGLDRLFDPLGNSEIP